MHSVLQIWKRHYFESKMFENLLSIKRFFCECAKIVSSFEKIIFESKNQYDHLRNDENFSGTNGILKIRLSKLIKLSHIKKPRISGPAFF